MQQYLNLLSAILERGVKKKDRTKTGTKSIFGYQMRFNLSDGFPLLTTKRLHLKSIIHELLWFLKGETHIGYLQNNKVFIWDHWANEKGELGPIYGFQWRSWPDHCGGSIDQINQVIEQIRNNPDSRRLIVSAWNVAMLPAMALPPCHLLFQFYVANKKLSLQLYQRSADVFLGLPFNIASYALLLMMIAQITDLQTGEFIHTLGDAHVYNNHINQIELQLKRSPRFLPQMQLNNKINHLSNFKLEDFNLKNYMPHPHIKGKVAI